MNAPREFSDRSVTVVSETGVVSAQLEVGVGEALVRLRAHAFAHDRPLTAWR